MEKAIDERQTSSVCTEATASTVSGAQAWKAQTDAEAGTSPTRSRGIVHRCIRQLKLPGVGNTVKKTDDFLLDTVTRTLDGCPRGYGQIATFQASDPNFLQYRGFSYLHCRLLSALQYDVEVLENELDALDTWDSQKGDPRRRLVSKENDDLFVRKEQFPEDFQLMHKRTRVEVMAELKTKLLEYDELLLKTKEMGMLQRPSPQDYRSLRAWFVNHKPVVQAECDYVKRREDIVTLRTGRETAGFDNFVEKTLFMVDTWLMKVNCRLVRNIFITKELREKSSDPDLLYHAPERVDTLVGLIITTIIFTLLVLPVVAMFELSNLNEKASPFEAIALLIVFTLLFGLAMSALTKATRHELFAASAAYMGVLVVFIGNFSTQTVVISK